MYSYVYKKLHKDIYLTMPNKNLFFIYEKKIQYISTIKAPYYSRQVLRYFNKILYKYRFYNFLPAFKTFVNLFITPPHKHV